MDNAFPIEPPKFDGSSRVVNADTVLAWFKQGWAFFMANPALWIALTIVYLVVLVALMIVPVIGALASYALTPLLMAGMLYACQKAAKDETLEIGDLFIGFKQNTNPLLLLGAFYAAAMVAIMVLGIAVVGGGVASSMMMGVGRAATMSFASVIFGTLVVALLMMPVFMALWFAPALVLFNNMAPVDALKASFNACLKNTLPFLIYGFIALCLMFFASLPLMLGWLVLVPVLFGTLYVSYQDIFLAN